ncbi:MAG TPA: hypothetical protein VEC36_09455 [Patescibacteria group bacterium]|nr:hypothetical protein [Patescibacteria group bacterium]
MNNNLSCKDFEKYSDKELQEIFSYDISDKSVLSNSVLKLIDEHKSDLLFLKELAAKEYVDRKINGEIHQQTLAELLEYIPHEIVGDIAQNALGELAIFNRLSENQLLFLAKHMPEGEWALKQVKARLTVNFCAENFHECLENLISLHTTWAILEIVKLSDSDFLNHIEERMSDVSILNKRNRNLVLEEIRKCKQHFSKLITAPTTSKRNLEE